MTARARRLSLIGAAVAAVALLAGSVTWLVALSAPRQEALPVPSSVQHSAPPHPVSAAKVAAPRVPASPPAKVMIPSIGVNAPVTAVGLDRNHALQVPPLSAHNLAGWYDRSAKPGQAGPSVIVGHVDSTTGPSVFFDVRSVKPGAEIRVQNADHHTVTFKVQWVQEASKTTFPTKAVYGDVPYPALRLITCGGAFDSATGHYQDNIIVYAAMT